MRETEKNLGVGDIIDVEVGLGCDGGGGEPEARVGEREAERLREEGLGGDGVEVALRRRRWLECGVQGCLECHCYLK